MQGPISPLSAPVRLAASSIVASLAALVLSACGSSDSSTPAPAPAPTPTTQLRAIHASSDAPNVDVLVNGAIALKNVPYETASAFLQIPAGTTQIQVNPTGSSTSVINDTVSLAANQQYTAIAVGLVDPSAPSSEQISAVLVDDPGDAPAAGNVKVRVVHGAPAVPAVDIYVTAPGVALPSSPTISALSYTSVAPASGSEALQVPGGSYEIRATLAGQSTVVFDSGTVSLPANADILVIAIPASGVSPVGLLVAAAGAPAAVVNDARAAIRVAHFSPNVPAVDVTLTDAATSATPVTLTGVTYPNNSGYAVVPATTYNASVALATSPSAAVLTLDGAALAANTSTSVFAIGIAGATGSAALQLAAFPDDRVPLETQAKVRVIHLSPDAPAVDVVALGSGGTIAATLVSNLSYPNATSSDLQVAPGTYTLAVVPHGATSPVLPTSAGVTVTLTAGEVATVAAIGCLNPTSGVCATGDTGLTPQGFSLNLLSDN
jgi:hypothetical protein